MASINYPHTELNEKIGRRDKMESVTLLKSLKGSVQISNSADPHGGYGIRVVCMYPYGNLTPRAGGQSPLSSRIPAHRILLVD